MPRLPSKTAIGVLLVWLTSISTALCQYQPYAVQWLQHAYNPCAGRQYLGVTNLYAGTNVVFSRVGDCDFSINVNGTLTNTSVSTNSIYSQYATNWLGSTNFFTNVLNSITNLPYTVITNPPWQWGCPNLTNWCNVSTNTLTNILLLDSNYTWTSTTTLSNGVNTVSNFAIAVSNRYETSTTSLTNAVNTVSNYSIAVSNTFQTNAWHLNGNALGGTGPFLGSTDNQPLQFKVNNTEVALFSTIPSIALGNGVSSTGIGSIAIGSLSSASANQAVAIGVSSRSLKLGAVAVGAFATSDGSSAVALGPSTAEGDFSFAVGNNSTANGNTAFAMGYFVTTHADNTVGMGAGAEPQNAGSFVFQDANFANLYNDTAPNQFVATFDGGFKFYTDGADFNIVNGPAHVQSGLLTVSDATYTTNGCYITAPTNAIATPPLVVQPLGFFGSMMLSGTTNTITVGSSATYYTLTNYSTVRTNRFHANKATGFLTNEVAGFYHIYMWSSCVPTGNGQQVEMECRINGTGREEISCFHSFDTPPRVNSMASDGILYLPANSSIEMTFRNPAGANNITIWRAGLTVGTP